VFDAVCVAGFFGAITRMVDGTGNQLGLAQRVMITTTHTGAAIRSKVGLFGLKAVGVAGLGLTVALFAVPVMSAVRYFRR
jgi:hypothetical protein